MRPRARLQLRCSGIVQGVGFRPFVHRLAMALELAGEVENVRGSVRIDLEGGKVIGKEDLLREANQAFRDVVQGPDGYLYVANKDFDGIFRVVPQE